MHAEGCAEEIGRCRHVGQGGESPSMSSASAHATLVVTRRRGQDSKLFPWSVIQIRRRDASNQLSFQPFDNFRKSWLWTGAPYLLDRAHQDRRDGKSGWPFALCSVDRMPDEPPQGDRAVILPGSAAVTTSMPTCLGALARVEATDRVVRYRAHSGRDFRQRLDRLCRPQLSLAACER